MTGTKEDPPVGLRLHGLVQHVHGLLSCGRNEEALSFLVHGQELANDEAAPPETMFVFYRLFGQAARIFRRFDVARQAYGIAYRIAEQLAAPDHASAALEGLGLVEMADDRLSKADKYLAMAVALAKESGDGLSYWATLNNHALVLSAREDPRAVDLYEEASTIPDIDARTRAIGLDNLGQALFRQRRFEEAVEKTQAAVALFRDVESEYDEYKALFNLASRARSVGKKTATDAFVAAHDLIHRLHAEIDAEHYTTGYKARVREIERQTHVSLAEKETSLPPALEIGIAAHSAREATERGEELSEKLQFAEAERLLRQAEATWEHIGAHHCLPRVWNALGTLYMYTGDYEASWEYLERARLRANGLGDAPREVIALTGQCSLMTRWDSDVEGKILEILAKARALRNFVRDRLLASVGDSEVSDRQRTLATNYSDLGILDSIAAGIAGMYGAVELQEKYLRRFVEAGKLLADVAPARLASRRGRLLEFLLAAGKEDEAAEIVAELEASLATNTDVAMSFVVNTALGVLSVNRGEWTEQTLDRLEQACVAHSEIRRGAIDVGEIGRFGVFALPPFQEAIEVAITLGHPERAFDLLQSAKSRTLLDALRDKPPAVDGENPLLVEEETLWQQFVRLRASSLTNSGQELTAHQRAGALFQAGEEIDELRRRLEEVWNSLADSHPEIRTHRMASPATVSDVLALLSRRGDATLVEFFVGRKGIYTFTVAAGRIAVNRVVDENDPSLDEFFDLVRDDDPHNVTRLLGQPVYQKLVRIVGSTSGRTYLAPYGPLHLVPLHLLSHDDGTLAPRPGTFLVPSASLLRATHSGSLLKRETLVIGGDPLGDLPFARSESTGIAARLGGEARHGGDVTFDWLVGALDGSARLVHLACHAAFDDVRPERSSLLLADSEGNPDRITLPRLASLNWSGALVVLSACQSGKHHVRTGDELTGIASTLLAAGATALVTSFRPVPDRATAVLMLWFYERLAQHGDWSLESVSDALTTAQRWVAEASAHDILSWVRRSVEANDMDPTLAYGMLAAAHRAAGETDRYLSCQQRLRQLSANELTESLDDLLRSATPPPRSDYTARPFKHAANWAMFSIITGG